MVIIDYLFPLQRLLGLGFWTQVAAAGLRVAAPMFFAGIIFARWFEQTKTPSTALGANLIGAVFGGLLEYLSLVIGLRQLYVLVLVFYAVSAAFAWRSPPPVRPGAASAKSG